MTRILVVDDEHDILESTRMLLDALGFETVGCDQASQVLATMRATRPDLVLHDVRMPGLDLRDQLRSIRADADVCHVPFVLFTATLEAKTVAQSVGADDGIEKPFTVEALMDLLHRWARDPDERASGTA